MPKRGSTGRTTTGWIHAKKTVRGCGVIKTRE